jgi:DNA-binding response OmpR family regulator
MLPTPVGPEEASAVNPGVDVEPALRGDRYSVLIVDDDASFVEAAAVFLGSHGYHAIKAFSGKQAMLEAQGRSVDLAIIDLYLPDISGVRVTQEVRRVRPSAVVIMISSDDSEATVRRCIEAGACAFLAKPLAPREFLLRIGESMGRPLTAR